MNLSDLARIGGVGPVFARMLYEAGVDTPEELVTRSPVALLERLREINQGKGYTRVMLSEKDIVYCVDKARELPKAIEY